MFYEINIAKNGVHFFATAERSITTETKLKIIYDALKKAFTEKEGYTLTVQKFATYGKAVEGYPTWEDVRRKA